MTADHPLEYIWGKIVSTRGRYTGSFAIAEFCPPRFMSAMTHHWIDSFPVFGTTKRGALIIKGSSKGHSSIEPRWISLSTNSMATCNISGVACALSDSLAAGSVKNSWNYQHGLPPSGMTGTPTIKAVSTPHHLHHNSFCVNPNWLYHLVTYWDDQIPDTFLLLVSNLANIVDTMLGLKSGTVHSHSWSSSWMGMKLVSEGGCSIKGSSLFAAGREASAVSDTLGQITGNLPYKTWPIASQRWTEVSQSTTKSLIWKKGVVPTQVEGRPIPFANSSGCNLRYPSDVWIHDCATGGMGSLWQGGILKLGVWGTVSVTGPTPKGRRQLTIARGVVMLCLGNNYPHL